MKTSNAIVIATVVGLLLGICGPSVAAPLVDGRFLSSEGYTHHWSIDPTKVDPKKAPVDPADLWMAQAGGDLYVAMILPKTYVDNSCGVNSIGWPGKKGHEFKSLVGSDKSEFEFSLSGATFLDVKLDYISEDAGATSGYRSLGATGKDGGVEVGSVSDIVSAVTSLDFDLNSLAGGAAYTTDSPATDDDYTPNAAIPDWVYEVTYEFRVAAGAFGNIILLDSEGFTNGFGMVLSDLHASPHKNGEFKDIEVPPESPTAPETIPEPATVFLLGSAMAGMGLIRRRRSRK